MKNSETRLPFRILAGMIGLLLLCYSLPVALFDGQIGLLERIFFIACSFIGGVGLLTAAYSGRWFRSPA
jgi:hypothetical protein